MLGDVVASANPDPIAAQDVIDKTGKRGGARRLAGEAVMQSDDQRSTPGGVLLTSWPMASMIRRYVVWPW